MRFPIYLCRDGTLTFEQTKHYVGVVYSMGNEVALVDGWLRVGYQANGKPAGYYFLTPATAWAAALSQQLGLFAGPEKCNLDFLNDVPKTELRG